MTDDASPASPGKLRRCLGEAPAMLPLIALGALLAWLAFAQAIGQAEAGLGAQAPAGDRVIAPAPADVGMQISVVAVTNERATELTTLLAAESRLRSLLGEPSRTAEVIRAVDEAQAEGIASALRDDFGRFTPPFAVVVVR